MSSDEKLYNAKYYFTESDRENFTNEIKNLLPHSNKYYLKPGAASPSFEDGISLKDESNLRWICSEIIKDSCKLLRLPITTMAVAASLFHRFFYRFLLDHPEFPF